MSSTPKRRNERCSICLEQICNPIALPCNHEYCYACLESWRPKFDIFNKRTCPKCRRAIPPTREMMTTINSIKKSFITIKEKLHSTGPLAVPDNSAYAYIRLLPKSEQQQAIRRALERAAHVNLDTISQFEKRYGVNTKVLDDRTCFDELPANLAEAVRVNDISAILAFLGPPPVPKRRLHAKCRSYSDDTLLHMAASYCNIPLIKLLLFLGADVNTPNLYQFTPLFHSLIDTRVDSAARLLLCCGARKVTQCSDRLEPSPYLASIARREGKAEMSQLLGTLLGGRRCVIHEMYSVPQRRGNIGIVGRYDSEFNIYEVTMECTGELLRVSSQFLKRCDQTPKRFNFTESEFRALGELALLYNVPLWYWHFVIMVNLATVSLPIKSAKNSFRIAETDIESDKVDPITSSS